MNSQLCCLLLIGLCLTTSMAYPQNSNWNNNQRPRPGPNWQNNGNRNPFLPTQAPFASSTTTVASTSAVTTPSPRYLACLAGCPSTMEYNPVCGTDNISYHNNARLQCAVRCGQSVSMVRMGTCTAL